MLAALVVAGKNQLWLYLLPGEVRGKEDPSIWREGDEGQIKNTLFTPMFVYRNVADAALELGIDWAAEEGMSLILLKSSAGQLNEALKAYRYHAPI